MFRSIRRLSHAEPVIEIVVILVMALATLNPAMASPVDLPSGEVLAEAKQIVKEMMDNPRGPYSRIRWYCNDGTEHAPKAGACSARGGGRQHAEYSGAQKRLAKLGWSVGTLLAPIDFESFKREKPREQRLRELALEQYLRDVDNGWVLRQAQYYRGRAQLEDEIVAGQNMLEGVMLDEKWLAQNYLLARELVRVLPHGEESDLSRKVRRVAIDLAEREPAAEKFRVEIHSAPNRATAAKLVRWAESQTSADVKALATSLANDLNALYGEQGRRQRLQAQLTQLKSVAAKSWADAVNTGLTSSSDQRNGLLCKASHLLRAEVLGSLKVKERVTAFDVLGSLETEVQLNALEQNARSEVTRADLLKQSATILDCVYGAGLISLGEHASATGAVQINNDIGLADYSAALSQLKRVPNWAAGTVRYTFAEALVSYSALEPRTVRFTDDLLRGSPLWLLGDVLKSLGQDLATLSGNEVLIRGKHASSSIALNPGIAKGVLRIYETLDEAEAATPKANEIVALPETIAELKPVAGILTLGEGNALSHVQLLARNFGIPNVAIDYSIIDLLKPLEGSEVALIVSSDGNVILDAVSELPQLAAVFASKQAPNEKSDADKIAVPPADLSIAKLLALPQIRRGLSGKVIGPKAANLGELNALFPGRVAPALAVPFGIYNQHLKDAGLRQRIDNIYVMQKNGTASPDEVNTELASIQAGISKLSLSDELKQELAALMSSEFGTPGSYGVFVRSDTNVEDLPQFTGAGLSKTVANVSQTESLFTTIPDVWASVLSPRAIAWRSNLLTNPEKIYASVLIMKSVPSEKSGVLVTTNILAPNEPGLTASTAWGVGGAVSGEAAESLVIYPDSTVTLISEAKTPYQRTLAPQGGVAWEPAPAGPILASDEIEQLRSLANEVNEKYQAVMDENGKQRPWDIEFGFVAGELTLFQIRPLVEKSSQRVNDIMQQLRADQGKKANSVKNGLFGKRVKLDDLIQTIKTGDK